MNQSSRLSRKPVPIGQQKCSKCGHEKHFPSSEYPAVSRTCIFLQKERSLCKYVFKRNKILKLLMNMKLRLQRLTQTLKVI